MISATGFILIILALAFCILSTAVEKTRIISGALNGTAAIFFISALVIRSVKIGQVALTSTFEVLLFVSFCLCLIAAALSFIQRTPVAILILLNIITILFTALASSPLIPDTLNVPVPALRSFWLTLHVGLSFIGESFFALAFCSSLVLVFTNKETTRVTASKITYFAVLLGYPAFTIGALIFGAVWAQNAWGSWWNWDAKEVWALLTWLVYTLYLHQRHVKPRSENAHSWIVILGFLMTLFTFLGVNYLIASQHSYV